MRAILLVVASTLLLGVAGGAVLAFLHRVRVHEPWTERARQATEVRVGLATLALIQPLLMAAACTLTSVIERPVAVAMVATASFVGIDLVRHRVERLLNATGALGRWFLGRALLLLLNPTLLAIAVGVLFVDRITRATIPSIAISITLLAVAGTGVMVDLLKVLGGLVAAPERLAQAVERASLTSPIRARAVYRVPDPYVANAYAMSTHGAVAFTDGALAVLDDQEVEAVAAHELAHLTNSRVVDRLGAQARFLPLVFLRPLWSEFQGLAVVPVLLIPFVLTRWLHRRSRTEETRCDSAANPATLARALEKLHERNSWPATVRGGRVGTHPDLWTRLATLGMTAGRPRPEPPGQMSVASAFIVGFVTLLLQLALLAGVSSD
jgi:Zn-dependent protease with chaperone function